MATTQALVTPTGIRDGDAGAFAALVERRGNAVLAYCEAVCPPGLAARAAAEAFARFRGAVAAAEDPGTLVPETLLLGATRHAAASLTEPPPAAATRARLRRRGTQGGASETCTLVPGLLAARAQRALGPADQERLAQHLERHDACRGLAADQQRAEAAYAAPPQRTVPIGALSEIMAALATAAPITAAPRERLTFGEVREPVVVVARPDERAAPDPRTEDLAVVATPDDAVAVGAAADVGAAGVADDPRGTDEVSRQDGDVDATQTAAGSVAPVTAVVPDPASGSTTAIPRPPRRQLPGGVKHGFLPRYVLPALLVCAALLAAMAIAGVFSSGPAPKPAASSVAVTAVAPPADAAPVTSTPAAVAAAASARAAAAEARAAETARATAAKARAAARARRTRRAAARRRAAASTAAAGNATTTTPARVATSTPATSAPAPVVPRKSQKAPATVKQQPAGSGTSALPQTGSTPTSAPGVFDPTTP